MSDFCGAKTRSGSTCRQRAITGGNRCYIHGGSSPQAKAKAAERIAEQRARRYLADLGGDVAPVTDPIGELERLGGQAVALVDLLRGVVSELQELRYRAMGLGAEQVRGELQAYMAAMARAESILGRIVSLNLDERRTRIQEAQVEQVLAAIGRALDQLGLSEGEQQRAAELIAAEFRRYDRPRVAALPVGGVA